MTVTLDDYETQQAVEIIIHFNGNGSGTQAVTFASDGAQILYRWNAVWTNRVNVQTPVDQV